MGLTAIPGHGGGRNFPPSTNIADIMVFFKMARDIPILAWSGAGLIMVAFAFKAALVPFHWWSPDAYEGAPTTVTAFMSTAPKAAAFAAFLRVFYDAFGYIAVDWVPVLWWIAVLTMTVGNLLALRQDSVKRMLAFSSITHAGYLAAALISIDTTAGAGMAQTSVAAILFYLIAYALMNIGAFLVAIMINRDENDEQGYHINDYKGLAFRKPLLAFAMLVFMVSLSGIPPTAGFFGKYYIFANMVKSGFVGLAVIGVLNSAVSVYYYLRVVVTMYLREREDEETEAPLNMLPEMNWVVVLCMLLVLAVGLFPNPLLQAAKASAAALALH
jgi:NADH-quinone oxidoreductase subunit N